MARLLFVNHTSRMAGAEMVLLDVVRGFRDGSAFLFQDGPLRATLFGIGMKVFFSAKGQEFANIKRDRSLLRAVPHLGRLARLVLRLRKVALKHDVIYANSQKAFVVAAFASATARRPLVWHLHDILTTDHFGRGQIRLTVKLANLFASRVIVPSKASADAFLAAGGREELVRVVPNGLDRVAPRFGAIRREALEFDNKLIFGVFSRLAPWKGQEVALRALAECPESACIIAGGALFGEQDYARGLVSLARELGVENRVHFIGATDDVPAYMQAVDVVVHPSTQPEPFGRTLVEAMLERRPLIAADAGAVPEILDHGSAGLLFPPGDHHALAQCLRRVLDDGVEERVDRAELRAREHYNARRMRHAIQDVIAELTVKRR